MMRIVFVAPWVPSAERPRSLGLLEHLVKQHEVHVVVAAWSREEKAAAAHLPGASVTVVRQSKVLAVARVLVALISTRSLQQAFVGSRALKRVLGALLVERNPDVLYFNVIRSAHLIPSDGRVPVILDLDEFRSEFYRQLADRGRTWHRVLGKLEAPRMARAEFRAVRRSTRYLVSSPTDCDEADPKAALVRSPHQIAEHVRAESPAASPDDVLFVGRMSYSANVEAVTWFAKHVWPELARRRPTARWHIVGADPTDEVLALSSESVVVTGRVASVEPFYASCGIVIIPVHMATGVQMKLIEALYVGVPVVTTRLVSAQAGIAEGVHVAIADTPEEWITALDRIWGDPNAAASMAARGSRWARENYSPAVIGARLEQVMNDIGDGR